MGCFVGVQHLDREKCAYASRAGLTFPCYAPHAEAKAFVFKKKYIYVVSGIKYSYDDVSEAVGCIPRVLQRPVLLLSTCCALHVLSFFGRLMVATRSCFGCKWQCVSYGVASVCAWRSGARSAKLKCRP